MKHWPTQSLGDLCNIVAGRAAVGAIPYLEIGNLDPATKEYKCSDKAAVKGALMGEAGDVIISRVRPTRGAITLLRESHLAVSSAFTILRTKREIDNKFLLFSLAWNKAFLDYLGRSSKGALYPTVAERDVLAFEVRVPPVVEQKRIVKLLDEANELRKLRAEAERGIAILPAALFHDMFESRIHEFKMVKIEEVAAKSRYSLSSGPFGSSLTSAHYTSSGVIVLRGLNVSKGRLNLEKLKYISEEKSNELARSATKPGDVVVVAVGSSGQAFQIPENLPIAVMSQNFNKVTPDRSIIDPTFLEHCINSPLVQRQFYQEITDTVRTFLSLTKLKNVKIPLPPLTLQKEFAKRVTEIRKMEAEQAASHRRLNDLFQSLLHRAFQGEL